ncbi:MAG: hypothetical protein ACXVZO_08870 [Gaiellaceae bacterium]
MAVHGIRKFRSMWASTSARCTYQRPPIRSLGRSRMSFSANGSLRPHPDLG